MYLLLTRCNSAEHHLSRWVYVYWVERSWKKLNKSWNTIAATLPACCWAERYYYCCYCFTAIAAEKKLLLLLLLLLCAGGTHWKEIQLAIAIEPTVYNCSSTISTTAATHTELTLFLPHEVPGPLCARRLLSVFLCYFTHPRKIHLSQIGPASYHQPAHNFSFFSAPLCSKIYKSRRFSKFLGAAGSSGALPHGWKIF